MADSKYDRFAYPEAIELYEGITGADTNQHIIQRLANSYRLTNNSAKAEEWYARRMAGDPSAADDMYHYVQALRSNEKYPEAHQWMQRYGELQPEDSRVTQYRQLPANYLENLREDQGRFRLQTQNINTAGSDFGAAYWNDQVVFASSRNKQLIFKREYAWDGEGYLNMFVSSVGADGSLEAPEKLSSKLNTRFHEGPATFHPNGQEVFFTRNNFNNGKSGKSTEGVNNLKIFTARWQDQRVWGQIRSLPINSDEYSSGHPSISQDGQWLLFASDRPGGHGGSDIYAIQRTGDGWSEPQNLGPEVNTEGNELFPFIHPSGKLFFASDGRAGLGGLDLFVAYPGSESLQFTATENLGAPVNSSSDDFALLLDSAEANGYFSSNRPGGEGSDDIYGFTLLRPFRSAYFLTIQVVDAASGAPLANAVVEETSGVDSESGPLTTDSLGQLRVQIAPEAAYRFKASRDTYFEGNGQFASPERLELATDLSLVIPLTKDPGFSLVGTVIEQETSKPIDGVVVTLTDIVKESENSHQTAAEGHFQQGLPGRKLNERIDFSIRLEKEGFLTRVVNFDTVLTQPGEVDVTEFLRKNSPMIRLRKGMDIGKLLGLRPIYFDVNKSQIRPDAAAELDKIVKVMRENPNMVIELGSHTDSRGSDAYNMKLSDRRAKSSAAYVIEKGIDASRITGRGFGESKLVNECSNGKNCSDELHQLNRRTEFRIV
ncbi:MAG: OmpA family protein, partial [Bacteroidota bacterium]